MPELWCQMSKGVAHSMFVILCQTLGWHLTLLMLIWYCHRDACFLHLFIPCVNICCGLNLLNFSSGSWKMLSIVNLSYVDKEKWNHLKFSNVQNTCFQSACSVQYLTAISVYKVAVIFNVFLISSVLNETGNNTQNKKVTIATVCCATSV